MDKQKASALVLVHTVAFCIAMGNVEARRDSSAGGITRELQVEVCENSFPQAIQKIVLYMSELCRGLEVCHTARNPENISYFSS